MECTKAKYKTITEAVKNCGVDHIQYCPKCECWHVRGNEDIWFKVITEVLARAISVLGRSNAATWMVSEIPALGGVTPMSCITTTEGVLKVNDVLTQMEHGVW